MVHDFLEVAHRTNDDIIDYVVDRVYIYACEIGTTFDMRQEHLSRIHAAP